MIEIEEIYQVWLAVIEQAICDFCIDLRRYENHAATVFAERIKREAAHWLFKSDNTGVGSLPWICENLTIPIECVRRAASERTRSN